MKAIILAGGFATRLYPITLNTSKSLLKIKNKFVIDFIIDKLKEIPLTQIIVVTNHKFYKDFLQWNVNKKVIVLDDGVNSDNEKKGAIGDLFFAINKENINEDLLVISGDNLFKFSLIEPYEVFKKEKKNLAIFYDVGNFNEATRFGVGIVKNNLLIDFQEKPINPRSTLCSTSIYFYKKDSIPFIKDFAETNADQPGLFLQYVYKKIPIIAYITKEKWIDIGTKEALKEAEIEF
jgi:glucose-1-phosphate thymidylyltransferase